MFLTGTAQTKPILETLEGFHVAHDEATNFAMHTMETLKGIKELGSVVPEFILSFSTDLRPVWRIKLKTRWLPILPPVTTPSTEPREDMPTTEPMSESPTEPMPSSSTEPASPRSQKSLRRIKSAHRQHYVKAIQEHLKSLHLVTHSLSSN